MNARRTPARIGQAHFTDQIDDLARNGRSTLRMTTLPFPIETESLSVPSDDSLGFDDHEGRPPTCPQPRQPDPQQPIRNTKVWPAIFAEALQDQYLMSKCQDFGLHCYSTSKALANRREQREKDRKHGTRRLPFGSFKFNGLNQNRVFGRDRSFFVCGKIACLLIYSQSQLNDGLRICRMLELINRFHKAGQG